MKKCESCIHYRFDLYDSVYKEAYYRCDLDGHLLTNEETDIGCKYRQHREKKSKEEWMQKLYDATWLLRFPPFIAIVIVLCINAIIYISE